MHTKWMTEAKFMTFQSFQISMRILCLSNHLGCWFSLWLLVDLAKTYKSWWSLCSNDQIIKNLWLPEVRNLLMQCNETQYNKAFGVVGCVDLKKLYEIKKVYPKQTTEQKVMTF